MAAVCEWFGLKTTQTIYSGLASKPAATVSGDLTSKYVAMVSSGLASKPTATVSDDLASKPAVTVFPFGPQNRRLRFDDLGFKITVMVFWFGPQKQACVGLSVVPQNRRIEVGARHAPRFSGLLYVEASLARVFQFGLKTGRGTTMGGARGTITEVALKAS
jgi:hypothetical protein